MVAPHRRSSMVVLGFHRRSCGDGLSSPVEYSGCSASSVNGGGRSSPFLNSVVVVVGEVVGADDVGCGLKKEGVSQV